MLKRNIHVLYIGEEDWSTQYNMPSFVHIDYYEEANASKLRIMDVIILDREITNHEKRVLWPITRGYCLFVTDHVPMKEVATQSYVEGKMGQYLHSENVQYFLDYEIQNYFPNPYGEKFDYQKLAVSPFFQGKISSKGMYALLLQGEFGAEFRQVAFWKNTIPIYEHQCIDLYLEYQKTGSVEIRLRVIEFYQGAIDEIKKIWEFSEDELQDVVQLDNDDTMGTIFVSVLARGIGSLTIISLHDRYSRRGHGYFLPGGKRLTSSSGEEIFTYFEKGDAKPPFAIYFSGYRTMEGFEGYYMMRKFGCPFMLITDPRSEGGGFYVGNQEYEEMILNEIQEKMAELGFTNRDIILSGASMGSYGAVYYGAKLAPRALILAKPLVNMGNVAKNERIVRAGGFATSLDVMMKNYDSLDEESVLEFNQRLWQRFEEVDWANTKFIISYLYEDDYDPDGYWDILAHLKSEGVEVYGKGSHGRHTDNTETVVAWFKSQYVKILKEDFGRR